MFCKKCGKQMEDNWTICPECGEPVNGSNVENVIKDVESKKKKKSIFKRGWFWVVIVILGCMFMFGGEDESEPSNDDSDTKVESTEKVEAVEIYKAIAENDEPVFTISEKSINFMKAHPEFFPGREDIKGAISDFVDEEVTYAHLTKNISKYGDSLIEIYGQVVEIIELNDGEITYLNIFDYDGKSYRLYYLGSLDDVFEDTWIYTYALPFDIITYENMEATYTEAIVGAACYVGIE